MSVSPCGRYQDHAWSRSGSPTYCSNCWVTFPRWQQVQGAIALDQTGCIIHGRAPDEMPCPECRASLDADDCDSILLVLDSVPTWFPETRARVERLRTALTTPPTDT